MLKILKRKGPSKITKSALIKRNKFAKVKIKQKVKNNGSRQFTKNFFENNKRGKLKMENKLNKADKFTNNNRK